MRNGGRPPALKLSLAHAFGVPRATSKLHLVGPGPARAFFFAEAGAPLDADRRGVIVKARLQRPTL
jgi:hypothetical protein